MATMFSPEGLGQTVAVMDKSGKVVGSGKQILNIFKQAKAAYQERKAELARAREANDRIGAAPRIKRAYTVDDVSVTSSRRSDKSRRTARESHHGDRTREHRSEPKRRNSDSHISSDSRTKSTKEPRVKVTPLSTPSSPLSGTPSTPRSARRPPPLTRHNTFQEISPRSPGRLLIPRRTVSSETIDMDLAYGEPPPDLMMSGRKQDDVELSGLVGRAKFLLDEAKCVQHSVQSTITNLQKNPEAMAAIALTLGEISTLVKRMSPGALAKIRVLAPAVFGLLTSPQFLIAAGVGVGVTVIALGGYKIIKKIQAMKDEEASPEQMIALSSEVNRIESWRQGIADVESSSIGTSVDGELITPLAANLSRLNLAEEARSKDGHKSKSRSVGGKSTRTARTSKTTRSSMSNATTVREGEPSRTVVVRRRPSGEESHRRSKPRPSPLTSMFTP